MVRQSLILTCVDYTGRWRGVEGAAAGARLSVGCNCTTRPGTRVTSLRLTRGGQGAGGRGRAGSLHNHRNSRKGRSCSVNSPPGKYAAAKRQGLNEGERLDDLIK